MRKPTECSLRACGFFGVCLFGCGAGDGPTGRVGLISGMPSRCGVVVASVGCVVVGLRSRASSGFGG